MALIKCNECSQDVSDQALTCPHCGTSIAQKQEMRASSAPTVDSPTKPLIGSAGITVLILLALFVFFASQCAKSVTDPVRTTNQDTQQDTHPARSDIEVSDDSAETEVSDDAKETAALLLNLNGQLCAKVISIRKLDVQFRQGALEVRCIEYRGGSSEKTYIIDPKSGKAWPS